MLPVPSHLIQPKSDRSQLLDDLRAQLPGHILAGEGVAGEMGCRLPFGIHALDAALAGGGLDGAALHEVSAASPPLGDDAAATLFTAGIAARFAEIAHAPVVWALTRLDLYAPGLEQAGLRPDHLLCVEARDDVMALALAEDALRDGGFAAVIAEVSAADSTATRRLQLAASDGATPMLMLRRWRRAGRDPVTQPSTAMTRWRIGCAPSAALAHPGLGRARWHIDLARQRGGNPFSLVVEACDDTGRLALPAPSADRAPIADRTGTAGRATAKAA